MPISPQMKFALLFTFLFIGKISALFSETLKFETLPEGARIGVMSGTFDPWSKQDLARAKSALASGKIDYVVLLPVNSGSTEFPLAVQKRIDLIEAGVSGDSRFLTPGAGFSPEDLKDQGTLEERLRTLKPKASVIPVITPDQFHLPLTNAVKVSDVKAAPPEDIRNFMFRHPEYYIDSSDGKAPQGIQRKVFEKIRREGLYLGRQTSSSPMLKKALAKMTEGANKLGVFDPLRLALVKFLAKPDLTEFMVGEQKVKIEKYLGSGLNGDAYVVTMNGERTVLKVAKPSVMAKQSMQQATLVHEWITKNYDIELPKIMTFSEEGQWQALEMIKGKRLDEYIAEHGGKIPPEIDERLKKFHAEAERLNATSDIKLDISADNIFIRDGKPVLVDFGPTQPYQRFASHYEIARARWVEAGQAIAKKNPQLNRVSCIRNGLLRMLPMGSH